MTTKLQSALILFGLVAFVVVLAYFGSRKPHETMVESCAQQCHPKTGVLERQGPRLGREWRPDPRNLVCVCR
jgi:hypothetical protein